MSDDKKVMKYIKKLDNVKTPDQLDTYIMKIKKYKLKQMGGAAHAWDGDFNKKMEQLKTFNDKINESVSVSGEQVQKVVKRIEESSKPLADKVINLEESLADTLKQLKAFLDLELNANVDSIAEILKQIVTVEFTGIKLEDLDEKALYTDVDIIVAAYDVISKNADGSAAVNGLKELLKDKKLSKKSGIYNALKVKFPQLKEEDVASIFA